MPAITDLEARRDAFRNGLTSYNDSPDVEDGDIDFIINAALSNVEGFRQFIRDLKNVVVGEDEAIAARQRDAQNTQDGFAAGIPLNVGRNNLHELRPIH